MQKYQHIAESSVQYFLAASKYMGRLTPPLLLPYMKIYLLKLFYKLIRKKPTDFDMVRYWKFKDSVQAKVTKGKDGSIYMVMDGEKYPFPTFPRGHLLFGKLSKLKHELKNRVFNEGWAMLENGETNETVVTHIKEELFGEIADLAESMKYEMLPMESMCPAVKELYRAWTVIEKDFDGEKRENLRKLKEYVCFILQEDDGYRNRLQWLVKFFRPNHFNDPIKLLDKALKIIEHAEVIGDMKEKARLLRRITLTALQDTTIRTLFEKLCMEVKWGKVALTKADKFHFRGKYFKVDFPEIDY